MSIDPAPDVDPLRDVVVGDRDPTSDLPEARCGQTRYPDGWGPLCTRPPHSRQWRHIAGNSRKVVAVWDVRPRSDADALREAARRLRAGANVGENSPTALAAGLRGVANTFEAWVDETLLRDQPRRSSIAAMARVILEDADS